MAISSLILKQSNINRLKQRLGPTVKNKKTVSYFTFSLSLFTLTFFIFFAIRPTLITAITLSKSVDDLRKLNIDYENKISNIIRAQSEYEKIREQLPYLQNALPKLSSFHKLAVKIEDFALRSEVKINQFQIDNVPISMVNKNNIQKYSFSLIVLGNYQSIETFINHLVNWQRIVKINNIEINHEGSTVSGILRMNLKALTYYEP